MIDQAIRFAATAHQGMVRKGNNQPYIFHPWEDSYYYKLFSHQYKENIQNYNKLSM